MDIEETLAVVGPPDYDFLFDLVVDPDCADCEHNGEYQQAELEASALEWANYEGLAAKGRVRCCAA